MTVIDTSHVTMISNLVAQSIQNHKLLAEMTFGPLGPNTFKGWLDSYQQQIDYLENRKKLLHRVSSAEMKAALAPLAESLGVTLDSELMRLLEGAYISTNIEAIEAEMMAIRMKGN